MKCPLCVKDCLPQEDQDNFCMTQKNGQWILRIYHTYYYQVQTQLNVCNLLYCDFVVWTEGGSAVERNTVDSTFYETVMEDVKHFFIYGLLPEIIGKWYTRKLVYRRLQWCCSPSIYILVHQQQTLMSNLMTTAKFGATIASQVLAQ